MNPFTYVKNVGKSFGYIGYDVFKSFNPNMAQMMEDSVELGKDIKDSVKNASSFAGSKIKELDIKNSVRNYGKETWSNFKDDIKTGNFYNKGRLEVAQSQAMNAMFEGEDFDFNFDDDFDFGDDDSDYGSDSIDAGDNYLADTIEETSTKQMKVTAESAGFIADTINKTSEHSAKKIIAGNVMSTEYLATVQKQSAGAIIAALDSQSTAIQSQIANLSTGVSAIAQLSEPMAVHFQNASVYYTKSTELQTEMVEHLRKIVENTTPTDTRFKSSRKDVTLDDLVGMGGFDIKAYADMIKSNVKESVEGIKPLLDFVKMGTGGMTSGPKASPISSLLTWGLQFATPKETKEAMKNFNDFLPNFFRTMFGELEDKDFGIIGTMLKDVLLPKNIFKDKIDTSNYNKGKVDWDGVSRKALVEVIPYQLSQLVAAVTGTDQKVYNYETGKWMRVGGIKAEFGELKDRAGISAGGDYRRRLNDTLSKVDLSDEQRQAMQQEIDEYFKRAITERSSRFSKIDEDDFDYTKSGLSKETWEFMRNVNKAIGQKDGKFTEFVADVYSERNRYGKKMRELSENGESIFNLLFNDSLYDNKDELEKIKNLKKSSKLPGASSQSEPNLSVNLGKDKYGYDIWFYLQGLYKHTKHLSDNIEYLGGGGGKPTGKRKSKGGAFALKPIEDIIKKKPSAENITEEVENKPVEIRNVSQNTINDAIAEVMKYQQSNKQYKQLSAEAQNYKQMRDAAIASGQHYVKDDKFEKEIAETEAFNDQIQKTYDKITGGVVGTTAKEFQNSLTSIIGAPTRLITRYLNAATVSMNRMLFGDNKTGEIGLKEAIQEDLASDFLKPLRDMMTRLFSPFKAITSGLERMLFGEKDEEGRYSGKFLSEFGNSMKDSMKKAGEWFKGIFTHDRSYADQVGEETGKAQRLQNSADSFMRFLDNQESNREYDQEEARKKRQKHQDEKSGNRIQGFGGDDFSDSLVAQGLAQANKGNNESYEQAKKDLDDFEEMYKNGLISDDEVATIRRNMIETWGHIPGAFDDIDQAAKGRKITKTGLVAVSEGELIIPSELNPFYRKRTDKKNQIRKENNIVKRFWGKFAEGGTTDPNSEEYASVDSDISADNVDMSKSEMEEFFRPVVEKASGKVNEAKGAAKELASKVYSKIDKKVNDLFGTNEEIMKAKENINQIGQSLFKTGNTKDKLAAGAAGGLIGGGVGLLLGGPIMGAMIGGATGIIIKSKETQKVLFGEVDEEGNSNGEGILPKKVSDFMNKHIPGMAKGAVAGGAGGLFLGSPVLGALLGSAVGYVKSSDRAKEALFGKEGENGNWQEGFIPKALQDKLKSALPNMAVGAGVGALFGPMGMAANIILGSAIGFGTTTNGFKDWLFGKDRENKDKKGFDGFVGILKENMVDPIVGIFDKLSENIRVSIRDTFHDLSKSLRKIVSRTFKTALTPFGRLGKKILGGMGKGLEGLFGGSIFSVGTILNGINNKMEKKALKKGKRVYDRKNKRYMTADERNQRLEELYGSADKAKNKAGGYYQINEYLSEEGRTYDDVSKLNKALNVAYDPRAYFEKKEANNKSWINNELSDIKNNLKENGTFDENANTAIGLIKRYVKRNEFTEARKAVVEYREILGEDKTTSLMKLIDGAKSGHDTKNNINSKTMKDVLMAAGYNEEMAETISQMNDKEISRVLDNLKEDSKNMKFKSKEGKEKEDKEKLLHEVVTKTIPTTLQELLDTVIGIKKRGIGEDEKLEHNSQFFNAASGKRQRALALSGQTADGQIVGREYREGDTKEEDGIVYVFTNGQWEPDNTNTKTRETLERKDKVFGYLAQLPIIGGAVSGFKGIMHWFGDKLFGDGKDGKKGILTTLKEKLFGDGTDENKGFLSKITNFFTDPNFKMAGVEFASGAKGLVWPAVLATALAGSISGAFDGSVKRIFSTLGIGNKDGSFEDTKKFYDEETGLNAFTGPDGNPETNDLGQYHLDDGTEEGIWTDNNLSVSGTDTKWSTQFKKNAASRALLGQGSLLTVGAKGVIKGVKKTAPHFKKSAELMGKTNLGKGVSGIINKAKNSRVGKAIADSLPKNQGLTMSGLTKTDKVAGMVRSAIDTGFNLIGKALNHIPFMSKFAGKVPILQEALKESLLPIIKKAGTKIGNIAAKIGAAMPYIALAYVVAKGIDAWGNASSILGITDKPTFGQRVIATLIGTINAAIPIVGDLIPNKTLVDIFMKIAPKIGIDVSELQAQREESEKIAEAEGLTVEEYNQRNGNAGIFTKAGNAIKSTFTNIKEKGLGETIKSGADSLGLTELFELAKKGDVAGVIKYNAKDEDDSTLAGVSKNGVALVARNIALPMAFITAGAKTVGKTFDKVRDWGSNVGSFFKEQFAYGEKIVSGKDGLDFRDVLSSIEAPEGPFQGILKAFGIITRILPMPILMFKVLGKKISDTFDTIVGKIKGSVSGIDERNRALNDLAKDGKLEEIWNYSVEEDPENPVGAISKVTMIGAKANYTIMAGLYKVGGFIGEVFDNLHTGVSEGWAQVQDLQSVMKEKYEDGAPGEIWNLKWRKGSTYNILEGFHKAIAGIQKIFYGIGAGIKFAIQKVGEFLEGVKDFAKGKLEDWGILDKEVVDENGNTTVQKGFITKTKEKWNWGDGILGSLFTETRDKVSINDKKNKDWNEKMASYQAYVNGAGSRLAAGSSGFVSQMDPRYANQSLGGKSVAEMGCGPAAATMALNMRAKGTNMSEAINVARGYQTPEGTDIGYFGNFYRSKGVEAQYYGDRDSIVRSIAAGTPTVLMGRDPSNNSKKKSPFGPNNHYVVASGFDRNGNVIINDPEMKKPKKYSINILNNVRMGVGMGSGLGKFYKFGFGAGGGNLRVDEVTTTVWYFLKNAGFSDAAIAGIMGNMDAESGVLPDAEQPNGDHAIGICQWAKGRKTALINYAVAKGTDWTDLHTQLLFLLDELYGNGFDKQYLGGKAEVYKTLEAYMHADDPRQAAIDFEKSFERAGKPVFDKRIKAALYFYEQFAGKSKTGITSSNGVISTVDLASRGESNFKRKSATSGINYATDPKFTANSSYSSTTSSSQGNGGLSTGTKAGIAGTVAGLASAATTEGSLLDKIKSAFSTGFGASMLFGGISSVVNNASNSGESATEGITNYNGETIEANPPGAVFGSGNSPVDFMKSILGKISYSMDGPRNPEKGSADCSSTVQWAIRKATGEDIGGTTPAQYNSEKLSTVWYDGGNIAESQPTNLRPNDVLFFSRPNSDFTAGRTDRVGHVGIYEGNGQYIDHGSGKGPKEKSITGQLRGSSNNGGLIKVMRLKGSYYSAMADNSAMKGDSRYAAGSGIFEDVDRMEMSAAGSGLLHYVNTHRDKLESLSNRNISGKAKYQKTEIAAGRSLKLNKAFIGAGESGMSTLSTTKANAKNNDKSIALLIKSLIPLVEAIVRNTNSIDGIYKLVGQLVKDGGGSSGDVDKAVSIISETMKSNNNIDSSLKELKDAVGRILEG